MLTLSDLLNLFSSQIGANLDKVSRLNLVFAWYMDECDPEGSLELVKFTVNTDANGEGFIQLPDRYCAIRGAVETTVAESKCAFPLTLRNRWYEYAPGNMGMIRGSDAMRGIIPISNEQGDTVRKYKVPVCPTPNSATYFYCVCKLAFQFLENDADVVPVQNLHAISYGLKALDKRDAEDFVREDQLWAKGTMRINKQNENLTGTEALGKVQVDDDFCLSNLGQEDGWGGWGWR